MQVSEDYLEGVHEALNEALKPYRREWKRQERLSKFMEQTLRALKKDDFFQIAELLGSKRAEEIEAEAGFEVTAEQFQQLREYAKDRISDYRTEFIGDLTALAEGANLPLEIDFPRLRVRPGIEAEVRFEDRQTHINGKTLKSVDPARILTQLQRLDKRLYGRAFDPQSFIDGLFATYEEILEEQDAAPGEQIPIQDFYLRHVIRSQSKSFFQDMAKGRFRGYPLDEFSVDLWRFYESEISQTDGGYVFKPRSGRGASFWLLDTRGERRQYTSVAFQEMSE